MTDANRSDLGALAKLVIAAAVTLIVAGVIWYGITVQDFTRTWHDLLKRPTGPMKLRFLLQPSMAALLGIRDGRKDAASSRAPDFMRTVRNRAERGALLRDGLNTTARIILLGLAMDAIYQVVVLRTFYPFEALLVALLLAFLPYAVIRGLVVRLQHRRKYKDAA